MLSFKTNTLKKFGTIFHRVVMSSDEASQSVRCIKAVTYVESTSFGDLPSDESFNIKARWLTAIKHLASSALKAFLLIH